MSNDTFPIKVKISIYSKKDGGKNIIRKDTTNSVGIPIVFNEFRGVIQLTLAGEKKETNWSVFVELPQEKEFLIGHQYITSMKLIALTKDEIKKVLYKGQKFKIWEGHVFGEGEILELA